MNLGGGLDEGNARTALLSTLLSTSYGPCACRKLCVGHGGAASVTSEGLEILRIATERPRGEGIGSLASYVDRVVRETCVKHVQVVGDGEFRSKHREAILPCNDSASQ